MGYAGKVVQREQARVLRAEGLTMAQIAARLGVSRSSVSLWTRDVAFTPGPRHRGRAVRPGPLQRARLAEIEALDQAGRERLGSLSEQAFLAAGAALYAGEGAKGDREVKFANTDPALVRFFCQWLRRFFVIEEARLRVRVYLHEGLDLEAAEAFWSDVTGVPRPQFRRAYRPPANPSIRHVRHVNGCVYVRYTCAETHRAVMGVVRALLLS